jgi:hypothetical protein
MGSICGTAAKDWLCFTDFPLYRLVIFMAGGERHQGGQKFQKSWEACVGVCRLYTSFIPFWKDSGWALLAFPSDLHILSEVSQWWLLLDSHNCSRVEEGKASGGQERIMWFAKGFGCLVPHTLSVSPHCCRHPQNSLKRSRVSAIESDSFPPSTHHGHCQTTSMLIVTYNEINLCRRAIRNWRLQKPEWEREARLTVLGLVKRIQMQIWGDLFKKGK